jgi:hypothetical protein
MSIDEILNGRFEQEARQALIKMAAHCPPGFHPRLCVHIDLGGRSFVGVDFNANKGTDAVGCVYSSGNLPEAVDRCIALATGPEAIAKRRQELTVKLQAIEAELNALPAPEPEAPKIAEVSEAAA